MTRDNGIGTPTTTNIADALRTTENEPVTPLIISPDPDAPVVTSEPSNVFTAPLSDRQRMEGFVAAYNEIVQRFGVTVVARTVPADVPVAVTPPVQPALLSDWTAD